MKSVKNFLDYLNVHRITLLVVLVMIVVSINSLPAVKRQLNSWKLLPQPETLTELYFTNPTQLPTTYTPGLAQSLNFTVHNLEYKNITYSYVINEVDVEGNVVQPLTNSIFTLGHDQYKVESILITPIDLGQKIKISVDLLNMDQSIDYLLSKAAL